MEGRRGKSNQASEHWSQLRDEVGLEFTLPRNGLSICFYFLMIQEHINWFENQANWREGELPENQITPKFQLKQ